MTCHYPNPEGLDILYRWMVPIVQSIDQSADDHR
jgi:hypothetical protein